MKKIFRFLLPLFLLSSVFPLFGKTFSPYLSATLSELNTFDTSEVVSSLLIGGEGEVEFGAGFDDNFSFYGGLRYSMEKEIYKDNLFRSKGDNLSFSLGGGIAFRFHLFHLSSTIYFGMLVDRMYNSALTPSFSLNLSLSVVPKLLLYFSNPCGIYLSLPLSVMWVFPERVSYTVGVGITLVIGNTSGWEEYF